MADRSQYEAKYRAVYGAGVPLVSTRGFDREYEAFLRERQGRGRLVEFGCGEGHAAAMAASLGYDVVGIDIAPSAIAKARELYGSSPNLQFEVGDAVESESLPAGSFDVVADIGCLHVIESADDARRHVSNAYRVLSADGVAYFQNMVSPEEAAYWFPSMREQIESWRNRITSGGSTKVEQYEVNGRQVRVEVPSRLGATHRSMREQVSLLTNAGFRISHAIVHTPGVNSPFELTVVGSR